MDAKERASQRRKIKVPADRVRTREQILEGAVIARGAVWVTCYNCGGSTRYPSSMIPPGRCRLFCWAGPLDPIAQAMGAMPPERTGPTRGRLPVPLEKYVKRAQAADRSAYRDEVIAELERPAREAAAAAHAVRELERKRREELAAAEDEAYEYQRMRVSQHVGTIGERGIFRVRLMDWRTIEGTGNYGWEAKSRRLLRFRDPAGNVLVWWTSHSPWPKGTELVIRATVAKHSAYDGENQTEIKRATEASEEELEQPGKRVRKAKAAPEKCGVCGMRPGTHPGANVPRVCCVCRGCGPECPLRKKMPAEPADLPRADYETAYNDRECERLDMLVHPARYTDTERVR